MILNRLKGACFSLRTVLQVQVFCVKTKLTCENYTTEFIDNKVDTLWTSKVIMLTITLLIDKINFVNRIRAKRTCFLIEKNYYKKSLQFFTLKNGAKNKIMINFQTNPLVKFCVIFNFPFEKLEKTVGIYFVCDIFCAHINYFV